MSFVSYKKYPNPFFGGDNAKQKKEAHHFPDHVDKRSEVDVNAQYLQHFEIPHDDDTAVDNPPG